jgi:hypothetical protein
MAAAAHARRGPARRQVRNSGPAAAAQAAASVRRGAPFGRARRRQAGVGGGGRRMLGLAIIGLLGLLWGL